MKIVLFDGRHSGSLLPFTYTRPIGSIRCGIMTAAERWNLLTGNQVMFHTQSYLNDVFSPCNQSEEYIYVYGGLIPDSELSVKILTLKKGNAIMDDNTVLAFCGTYAQFENSTFTSKQYANPESFRYIFKPWHIFQHNDFAIRLDFEILTRNKPFNYNGNNNIYYNKSEIFIEEGASVNGVSLNAGTGPIYIGKEAVIMEGSVIRGPFALCEHAEIKMGAKIYGATTVGPYCKAGGELNNVVMFGYSNKGHDGFIGNAVIGEWCNLGADTNCSNLKNNYAPVKIWSHENQKFENTGLTFCGLLMADHSKCGINTMFNTGTVVGVAANIFGSGFPRNFIPSFSWGGSQGFETFQLNKVFEMATYMCARRNIEFSTHDQQILTVVFNLTSEQR